MWSVEKGFFVSGPIGSYMNLRSSLFFHFNFGVFDEPEVFRSSVFHSNFWVSMTVSGL